MIGNVPQLDNPEETSEKIPENILRRQGFKCLKRSDLEPDRSIVYWSKDADSQGIEYPSGRTHNSISMTVTGNTGFQKDVRRNSHPGTGNINTYRGDSSYSWSYDTNVKCDANVKFVSFYFKPKSMEQTLLEDLDMDPKRVEYRDSYRQSNLVFESIFQKLFLPLNWGDNADYIALTHVSSLMMYNLIKHYVDNLDDRLGKIHCLPLHLKHRLEDYIDSHLDSGMSIETLATITGYSRFHFLRMFKSTFGISPGRYVTQRRLLKARSLLEQNDLTATEVAFMCGFSSLSHFGSQFKTAFGMPPNSYRKILV